MEIVDEINPMGQDTGDIPAIKAPHGLPLKELLAAHTVDKLKAMAKAYALTNLSKMKKQELIEALATMILDPKRMADALILLDEEEYDFFNDVSCGNQFTNDEVDAQYAHYARGLGYLYLVLDKAGLSSYEVPAEVAALYRLVRADETWCRQISAYRLKWDYLKGLTWLYGIVPTTQVVECYNSNNHDQATLEDFIKVATFYQARNRMLRINQDYAFDEHYLDQQAFRKLQAQILDQPQYLPNEDTILRLATDPLGETLLQQVPIEQYLLSVFEATEDEVGDLCVVLQLAIHDEVDLPDLMDLVGQQGFVFEAKTQKEKFAALLIDLVNHSRCRSLSGYTPLELLGLTGRALPQIKDLKIPVPQPTHVEKIGRNDPCPCGSGKKYKKCCGK